MKHLLRITLFVALAFNVSAQDYTVEFRNEITSDDTSMIDAIAMMGGGNDLTVYMSGNNYRVETSMGMAGNTAIVMKEDVDSMLMLMENVYLGKKYKYIDNTVEDTTQYTVVKTGKSETIAGYKCDEYTVTTSGSTGKTIVYITTKIKGNTPKLYGGKVPGYAMKTVTEQEVMGSPIKSVLVAKTVTKRKISADKFSLTPPEGYEVMEEFGL